MDLKYKIGIGAGAGLGGIMLVGAGLWFIVRKKQRKNANHPICRDVSYDSMRDDYIQPGLEVAGAHESTKERKLVTGSLPK
jgi:hypothetical protein